ncbi:MAG TPA: hypothetical protein VKX17_09405 [Planctomycetota bacterium]|nr:hypothetical protein [Planctomycetota bacterium]
MKPLALHPDNPHYLFFRGKPTILITSGEHYGAVLNLDLNQTQYLDTLQKDGLNLTRTFSGIYCEPPGAFKIKGNTLAPAPGKLICPWARSTVAGYKNGGNKFDLDKWDDAYFARLKGFVAAAGQRGIVVEVVLFCPFYEDSMWLLSPLHPANNVNNTPQADRKEVWALQHDALTAIQDKMVHKFVEELRGFDNFYFEICNEPYFGGVTLEFQKHISETIADAEKTFPVKHLIAQNIANGKAKISAPNAAVSIFNFHYATPPDTVGMNYALNKVISDDETGFKGVADFTYRREAWNFILAGGGIFDNLDYSFSAGHETGDFQYPKDQPGGGSKAYRAQLRVLSEFMSGFDFIKMAPDSNSLKSVLPQGVSARVLSQPGKQYAIYIHGGKKAELKIELPAGEYAVRWINTLSGIGRTDELKHAGGEVSLLSPDYDEDIAVKIISK